MCIVLINSYDLYILPATTICRLSSSNRPLIDHHVWLTSREKVRSCVAGVYRGREDVNSGARGCEGRVRRVSREHELKASLQALTISRSSRAQVASSPSPINLEKARKTCIRWQAREPLRQLTASCTKCGKICSGSLRSSCYECNTVTTRFCFISLMFPRQGKRKYYQIDVPVFIKLKICFPSFF